jgi:flagellar biosynthesis protein FlhG
MKIIPIASGKGGVGKSLVAANLAVAFAQAGQRVILADLDLGASNLHLVIGQQAPKAGIGTFLNDTKSDLAQALVQTSIPNLRFLPGDTEIPGSANIKALQKNALMKRLMKLDADILIIDLGAGSHQFILDFFLLSAHGIVVSAPTVTATLNAYVFLKNSVFRLMYSVFTKGTKAHDYLEKIRKDGSGLQKLYIPKILEGVKKIDKVSYNKFKEKIDNFHPRLIMNMIEDPKDADVAMKIRRSCEEYLGLSIEHLGIIYRDNVQDIALSSRLPVVIYKPQAIISQAICRIADKIMQSDDDGDFILDASDIENSFQEASIEAEVDFNNKMEYVEELLHSGTLSPGDLIETVKSQQFEIVKLKKENNFLKHTLSKAISQGFKP